MVEIQTKAAPEQVRDRLFELTRYPWLDSVSDDRTLWVVRDLVGQRGRTARIDLNIEFQDGTRMTDPVNRALFEVAVEYVELVRLYQPEMNAETHRARVTRLLVFLYWLNHRGVRALNDVTQDHLALFLQDAEFGAEWVLGMPQRLVGFLQREVRSGRELPRQGNGRIDLRKIFRRERSHRAGQPLSEGAVPPDRPMVRDPSRRAGHAGVARGAHRSDGVEAEAAGRPAHRVDGQAHRRDLDLAR